MKKSVLAGLVTAIIAVAAVARAGDSVVTLGAKDLYSKAFYAEKGEALVIVAKADVQITCGLYDKDGDFLTGDMGSQSCWLDKTAPYTGKYRLKILNKSEKQGTVVISSAKDL